MSAKSFRNPLCLAGAALVCTHKDSEPLFKDIFRGKTLKQNILMQIKLNITFP